MLNPEFQALVDKLLSPIKASPSHTLSMYAMWGVQGHLATLAKL